MSIVQTLGQAQFQDLLRDDEYANWSYDAAEALYNYYEELSDDMGEPIEFDRVAIRCDWSEYQTLNEAYEQYEEGDATAVPDDDKRDYFNDRTRLIELNNGHVLVEAF